MKKPRCPVCKATLAHPEMGGEEQRYWEENALFHLESCGVVTGYMEWIADESEDSSWCACGEEFAMSHNDFDGEHDLLEHVQQPHDWPAVLTLAEMKRML